MTWQVVPADQGPSTQPMLGTTSLDEVGLAGSSRCRFPLGLGGRNSVGSEAGPMPTKRRLEAR